MRRFLLIACFAMLTSTTSLAQSESRAAFVLSKVDEHVVKEFGRAWAASANGVRSTEAIVLVFRMADGSIKAVPGGYTNEAFKFTFKWNPATFAVIHTHPNRKAPEPQPPDVMIADRFGVPMFTITFSGMYLYDPATRRTSKVFDGLDWLKLSSWARYATRATDHPIAKQ